MKLVTEYLTERLSSVTPIKSQDSIELVMAVSNGGASEVKRLLKEGANPDTLYKHKQTPIFLTANLDILEMLYNAGADFTHKDESGYNAMMHMVGKIRATHASLFDYFDAMIKYGVNFFDVSKMGHTIFDLKFNVAYLYVADRKLKNKLPKGTLLIPWDINELSNTRISELVDLGYELDYEECLMKASNANVPLIEILLKHAPKVYQKAFVRFASSWNPDEKVVKLFLKHGYKMFKKHATSTKMVKIFDGYSKMKSKDSTVLFDLIEDNDIDNIKQMINEGMDFEIHKDIYTPLLYAIEIKKYDIAKLLIDNKINIKTKSKNGATPLVACVLKNRIDLIEALLKNKVNINEKTKEGGTAFMWACKVGNLDTIKLLVDKGAKTDTVITAPNGRKYSAYDFGDMSSDKLEVTEYLSSLGVEPAHQ